MTNEAAAALIQNHRTHLIHFILRRVRCAEVANEIIQDTFLRLRGIKSQTLIHNPRAFLYRVTANLVTDYLRHQRRRSAQQAEETDINEVTDPAPSVEEVVAAQKRLERLKRAVAELPPRCREVFILLKIKQYTYAEVERELGISAAMIFKYMNRALAHCRRRLEEGD